MRVNYKIDWSALAKMNGSKSLSPKKFKILDTALKIIGEKGLYHLSVTEISHQANISKPLILYHYETKDRIIEDLLFYIYKMGEFFNFELADLDDSFENKIRALVRGYFRWYLFNKQVSNFLILTPHLRDKSQNLINIFEHGEIQINRIWEKVFLESLRYRSMEELKISLFGVKSLLLGTLVQIIHSGDRKDYKDHSLRLKFNLENLLNVELPSFEF